MRFEPLLTGDVWWLVVNKRRRRRNTEKEWQVADGRSWEGRKPGPL
jgi:hypothetical protein